LQPDAIIMDTESPSRDTLEQVVVMSEKSPRPIVMFSQDESQDAMRRAVSAGVAAYVVNGLESERIQPLLQLAQVRFEAWQAMREETLRARQELQEHKLVEQAKRYLMKVENLSEEAAYQALRREAMVQRKRIADVARVVMEMAKSARA
jgi:response regulator NasT